MLTAANPPEPAGRISFTPRLNHRLGSHSCQELTGVDFKDLRQAAIFSRSDEHRKCFARVADGAEVIATLISELGNQGELKR